MTDDLTKEQKLTILLAALEERYRSLHIIRDRVQNVCIWTLGVLLAASGWLVQSDVILSCRHKIAYVIGLLAAFAVLRFLYLADLNKGFKSQQQVAVRIELSLRLFQPGALNTPDQSIYPKAWEHALEKGGEGRFFLSTYMLLYTGLAILIFTILFKGWIL